MKFFKFFRNQKGFTLLELTVVLAVSTILVGAAMPTVAKRVQTAYAQKTAQEVGIIQDASKNYYIDNKAWPASVSVLRTANYLSSTWSGNNPWGNAYTVSQGPTPQTFKVSTTIPSELTGVATALLPSSSAVGGTVTSEIPVPGEEPSLESLVHRYSDDEGLRIMTKRLITPTVVGGTGTSAWGINFSGTADPDSGLPAGAGRIGTFAVGTTDTSGGKLTVSGTANQIQQLIKGYSAQTANLAEWQNSAGTVLASIDPSGNPTIQNTAPQLILKDTTTGAKYLLAKVDGDKAYLQEIGGTDGSLLTLDLSNNRLGIGENSPGSKMVVKGAGTTSTTSSFNVTDSAGNSVLYVRDDAYVGIRTANPEYNLTIGTGKSFGIGTTQWNSGDKIRGAALTGIPDDIVSSVLVTSAQLNTTSTSFIDVGNTLTVTSAGGWAEIVFSTASNHGTSNGLQSYRIVEDSTPLAADEKRVQSPGDYSLIYIRVVRQPTPGSHTYKIQWRTDGGTLWLEGHTHPTRISYWEQYKG